MEKEALVIGIATVVINVCVLVVNLLTAKATKLSAETARTQLLLSRRPSIDVDWEVRTQAGGRVLIVATVRDVAGVQTELRPLDEARIDYLDGQPMRKVPVAVSGRRGAEAEAVARVLIPTDLRQVDARVGPIAIIRIDLTVSAVGIDDPHGWGAECLLYNDDGAFEVFSSPVTPDASQWARNQGLFRHIADRWARWQAWVDSMRRPC